MQQIPKFLSNYQLEQLTKEMCTPMMREAVIVMYAYGLRISELCALEKKHVDLDHDVIRVTGKGKVRDLTITDSTRQILINAMNRPGKLFNVTVRSFRNYIYAAASRANIGHVHPHMIRHTTATNMLNAGESLPAIKAWMRHDFAGSTMIYTHVATDYMRKVGNRVPMPMLK